jgi:hypothetical protein
MNLANEWADGEDSIQNPRHCRRSSADGDDVKDHPNLGTHRVHQRARWNRYSETDPINMVAGGYTNDQDDNHHDTPRRDITY